jgi:hypothetical protein
MDDLGRANRRRQDAAERSEAAVSASELVI